MGFFCKHTTGRAEGLNQNVIDRMTIRRNIDDFLNRNQTRISLGFHDTIIDVTTFESTIRVGPLHCVPKKEATKLLAITLSNLNRFSKFCHC